MRYFDKKLLANSKAHKMWWGEINGVRDHFHANEVHLNSFLGNAAAFLPRDAWMALDEETRRVMRSDEGEAFMSDLMPLAKTVNIGKLAVVNRVASDSGVVVRSLSGQVPVPVDKTTYDYRGSPVPIFASGYGREWREWNTLQSENFDALSDDQEASVAAIKQDQAQYVLNGDSTIVVGGYTGYGIKTSPYSKAINLGASGGGANINLTTADWPAMDAFFSAPFGAMLDANLIRGKVNLYVSPEIARNLDKQVNTAAGTALGTRLEQLQKNRRINKIETTYELTGNQFFGFVPSAQYIRPLIGMAVNTIGIARNNPTDNYNFQVMGALGIDIRADINGRSGVFYSTDV